MIRNERRKNRSNRRGEALDNLLGACRARGDLRAIVLSDAAGFLVAGSVGPGLEPALVAALAPTARDTSEGLFRSVSLECDGEQYFLAFIGPPVGGQPWLEDALNGARRIIAS